MMTVMILLILTVLAIDLLVGILALILGAKIARIEKTTALKAVSAFLPIYFIWILIGLLELILGAATDIPTFLSQSLGLALTFIVAIWIIKQRFETTFKKAFVSLFIVVNCMAIAAALTSAYVLGAYNMSSAGMSPTLLIGDHVLVKKKLIYHRTERGDITVFRYPEDPSREFIQRIVAVEGDTIESRNKIIYINGKALHEPYIQHTDPSSQSKESSPRDNFGPQTVPSNKCFVLGDNRDQSYDSRYWGYVDLRDIEGKVAVIYWSWDKEKNRVRYDRIGLPAK
jgi:signal peptidase I